MDYPPIDLHRHLEGSVRPETIQDISTRHGLPLPPGGLDGLRRALTMDAPTNDIVNIFPRFDLMRQVFVNDEACARVTLEVLQDAAREGLGFVEIRFSPLFMAEPHGLDPLSVTAAVCEAWQEAQHSLPLVSRLLVILSRTYGPAGCLVELEAALVYRERGIVGLDLAGDEARQPALGFIDHYRRAREAGLRLTAHAGEFAGAESVRASVLELGAERLGHAVHAADDPATLDLLLERGVTIESCPTSNTFTCSVPSYAAHPLPLFLARGLRVCLNADDPTLFGGIDVYHEEAVAQRDMGVTGEQVQQMRRHALEAAFISDAERRAVMARVKRE